MDEKNNAEPFFSIITVCFNSESTIKNTLKSILNQSFSNFEYIIIDGVSKDNTLKIVNEYIPFFKKKNISVTLISENDTGIYNAMNKGIQLARGKYIGLLNSDDCYKIDCLKDTYYEVTNNRGYDVYHGICEFINEGKVTMYRGSSSDKLDIGMIEHPACFISKNAYQTFGLYDERYRFVADYDLLLRFRKDGARFFLMDKILVSFDENGAGNSRISRKEALLLRKRYGLSVGFKYIFDYIKFFIKG